MPTNRRSDSSYIQANPWINFVPALIWGFFILYFSLMPGNRVPDLLTEINDKLVHSLIYFVSAGLIYLGFVRYNLSNAITGRMLAVIIAICTIVGAVVEVLQHYWVENRNGDWQDFLANTLGSLVCVLLLRVFHGLRA